MVGAERQQEHEECLIDDESANPAVCCEEITWPQCSHYSCHPPRHGDAMATHKRAPVHCVQIDHRGVCGQCESPQQCRGQRCNMRAAQRPVPVP
ncbi:hypothetical protein SKAU_G00372800 [Synaphobranchus kaupii]|uniref:Uncharacterized protein n=1 Tax=Synaphobranchus kaupii TaxID=118154 RepID=A0A9Q1EGF6_SYNKA|nr:hypothetical protein SKAU_G00372800 [Synaphobranchus kaupii]